VPYQRLDWRRLHRRATLHVEWRTATIRHRLRFQGSRAYPAPIRPPPSHTVGSMLFTIVLEHNGATYIAQLSAPTVVAALRAWAHRAPAMGIPGVGSARAARLGLDPAFLDSVHIVGARNVWCASSNIAGRLALFHVVATATNSVSQGRSPLDGLASPKPKA